MDSLDLHVSRDGDWDTSVGAELSSATRGNIAGFCSSAKECVKREILAYHPPAITLLALSEDVGERESAASRGKPSDTTTLVHD